MNGFGTMWCWLDNYQVEKAGGPGHCIARTFPKGPMRERTRREILWFSQPNSEDSQAEAVVELDRKKRAWLRI